MDYRRPEIEYEQYVDDAGQPIPYGHRWDVEGPPEQAYSIVSHPQRFAPLVDVARALIDYLVSAYAVTVNEHAEGVSLVPESGGASIRFDVNRPPDHPGARVRAGLASDHWFPDCGCDACDPDIAELLDSLERFVFAVVTGKLRERLRGKWLEEQWPGGRSMTKITDRARRKKLRARAASAPSQWPAWQRR